MKSTYGYWIHTGVDEDGFIHRQSVTAGNAHGSTKRDTLLPGDEAAFFRGRRIVLKGNACYKPDWIGIDDQVQRKAYRGHPLSEADKVRNAEIAATRSGGERPFATYKTVTGWRGQGTWRLPGT